MLDERLVLGFRFGQGAGPLPNLRLECRVEPFQGVLELRRLPSLRLDPVHHGIEGARQILELLRPALRKPVGRIPGRQRLARLGQPPERRGDPASQYATGRHRERAERDPQPGQLVLEPPEVRLHGRRVQRHPDHPPGLVRPCHPHRHGDLERVGAVPSGELHDQPRGFRPSRREGRPLELSIGRARPAGQPGDDPLLVVEDHVEHPGVARGRLGSDLEGGIVVGQQRGRGDGADTLRHGQAAPFQSAPDRLGVPRVNDQHRSANGHHDEERRSDRQALFEPSPA
jgi:hypothetical protein